MPSKDAAQALEDIVANIQRIQRYVKDMSFDEYSGDSRTVDAVEHVSPASARRR